MQKLIEAIQELINDEHNQAACPQDALIGLRDIITEYALDDFMPYLLQAVIEFRSDEQ